MPCTCNLGIKIKDGEQIETEKKDESKERGRQCGGRANTCPWESTKVRDPHWQPRLTKGEAAFRSFVRLNAEEPVASRVSTRKFIFAIVFGWLGSGWSEVI